MSPTFTRGTSKPSSYHQVLLFRLHRGTSMHGSNYRRGGSRARTVATRRNHASGVSLVAQLAICHVRYLRSGLLAVLFDSA